MFIKQCGWVVAAAALGVSVGPAWADSVTVNLQTYKGGTIHVDYGGNSAGGGAGALLWKVQSNPDGALPYNVGADFITFCIEANESVNLHHDYTYGVISPDLAPNTGWSAMGPGRADLLGHWFGAFYLGDKLSDWSAQQAMAFQMGVWEIVAETDTTFDLDSGYLGITNQHTARNLAQGWLDQAGWQQSGAPSMKLMALSAPWPDGSRSHLQDQITAVPTPTAAAAGLMLLGGLGLIRRRRRQLA